MCMCQHLSNDGAALEDDEHRGIVADLAAASLVAADQASSGNL